MTDNDSVMYYMAERNLLPGSMQSHVARPVLVGLNAKTH